MNSIQEQKKIDSLACGIKAHSGCSWKEAFERAKIVAANNEVQLVEEENEQD